MESARIHHPLTISEAETFRKDGILAYPSTPGDTPETHQHASSSHAHEVRPQEGSGPNEGAGVVSLPRDPAAPPSTGILMGMPGARAAADLPASDCSDLPHFPIQPQPMPASLGRLLDDECEDAVEITEEVRAEIAAAHERYQETRELRDALFAQLLYRARDLAQAQIVILRGFRAESRRLHCNECRAFSETEITHLLSCRSGAVLSVIVEIIDTVNVAAKIDAAAQEGGAL
jgi:hypothetical protein